MGDSFRDIWNHLIRLDPSSIRAYQDELASNRAQLIAEQTHLTALRADLVNAHSIARYKAAQSIYSNPLVLEQIRLNIKPSIYYDPLLATKIRKSIGSLSQPRERYFSFGQDALKKIRSEEASHCTRQK